LLLFSLLFISGNGSQANQNKPLAYSPAAEPEAAQEVAQKRFILQYPECVYPTSFGNRELRIYDEEPIAPTPVSTLSPVHQAAQPIRTTHHILSELPLAEPYTLRWRIGVGIPEQNPHLFPWPKTRPGWYLTWTTGARNIESSSGTQNNVTMALPDEEAIGMSFAPMVRVRQGNLHPDPQILGNLAAQNHGRTWLIGNEPDVEWQDNTTPEEYAYAYRCAYAVIKDTDPSAHIAIGGVSQVTPLRLAYIDRIWTFYASEFGERMPVDIWNMHAFVLREEADSWGVRIPPGFEEITSGMLWETDDHSDIMLIREQIVRMRQWMAEHGEREKPLIISEYGILLPESFGYPKHIISEFMWDSFDLFVDLRDSALGYPADDNRLVQRWVWFSSRYHLYESGDLYDSSGNPTILTRALNVYIEQHAE